MTSLSEVSAVVAGGAGEVGEGIVRALLRAGARVAVPSRDGDRLRALGDRLAGAGGTEERLLLVEGDVGTPEGAADVRERIVAAIGAPGASVASVGGWWQGGPLWEVPFQTWERLVANNLTSHFAVARTFLPAMVEAGAGSHTIVTGGAGKDPVPGAAPIAATVGGVRMLKEALTVELEETGVRVNEILIWTPVATRSRRSPRPEWVTAEQVGRVAAALAEPGCPARGETIELPDSEGAQEVLARLREAAGPAS